MKLFAKLGIVSLLSCLMTTSLVGCGETSNQKAKVGIIQYATFSALNSANDGFIEGLKQGGFEDGVNITISYDNPEGDSATLSALAKTIVRDNDLVLGIATPAATALQAAAQQQNSKTKILFTAVTDPADSKLVNSNANPGGNITGTSDMNPVELQIDLLKEVLPSADTVGILYTISESNSKVQSDLAEKEAAKQGLNTLVQTVSDVSDIAMSVRKLISDGADVIYIPTDNLLASNMPAVTNIAYESKIPVSAGEAGMVESGGTFALGIDYYNLGVLTGKMAAEILNGKDTASFPVGYLSADEYSLAINQEACNKIGLVIPNEVITKYGD